MRTSEKRTKRRQTDHTDFYFSDWLRQNIPSPIEGHLITDVDFIIRNYKTKKLMLLEIKCKGYEMKKHQRRTFQMIHRCIKKSLPILYPKYEYLGFNLLTFENHTFNNGSVFWNGCIISESEIQDKLSF